MDRPTSLEALDRAIGLIKTQRVLVIATYRPEFAAPWGGQPHVSVVLLNRLGERESAVMIDRVGGDKPLPANVRRDIIDRTDGIPLFVEQA